MRVVLDPALAVGSRRFEIGEEEEEGGGVEMEESWAATTTTGWADRNRRGEHGGWGWPGTSSRMWNCGR
jgi:hypothetical protein